MSGSRSDDLPSVPNRDKGKAPLKRNLQLDLGDFSPSKRSRTDDQTERKSPRPNPRISYLLLGPKEGKCAKRTLAPGEANPTYSVLRIGHDYESFVFFDIPSFIDITNLADSVRYRILGEEKREYELALSRVSIRGPSEVFQWDTIVRDHKLRAGDEVSFDRYLDTEISNDFFYLLKCTRKTPLDAGSPKEANANTSAAGFNVIYPRLVLKKISDQVGHMRGPGSRELPPEAYCLTKSLKSFELTPRSGKLNLSLTDALLLTDNPRIAEVPRDGKYSKELVVFDGNNRLYRMTLNHNFKVGGSLEFCLGGGWIDFATRNNLEEGDLVVIYKILDSSVVPGYYHVLRYVPTRLNDFIRLMNGPLTADGIPLAHVSNPTASDQITTLMTATEQGGTVSYQGRNVPLASGSDQRRNVPLAAGSDRRRDIPEGSGSRSMMPSMYSTNKTLEPRDVSGTEPRLHLDALTEAKYLCEDPAPAPYPLGQDPRTLLVYDNGANPYEMVLSQYTSDDGRITYTLGGGDWQRLVRAHGLRAGDDIIIYKVLNTVFYLEYFCIFKKNPVVVHLPGSE